MTESAAMTRTDEIRILCTKFMFLWVRIWNKQCYNCCGYATCLHTCVYELVVTYHTTYINTIHYTHTASVSSAYNTSSVVDTEAASGDPSVAVVSAFYLLSLQTCTCWHFIIPAPSAKDLTMFNTTFAVLLSVFIKSWRGKNTHNCTRDHCSAGRVSPTPSTGSWAAPRRRWGWRRRGWGPRNSYKLAHITS